MSIVSVYCTYPFIVSIAGVYCVYCNVLLKVSVVSIVSVHCKHILHMFVESTESQTTKEFFFWLTNLQITQSILEPYTKPSQSTTNLHANLYKGITVIQNRIVLGFLV